jgi:hypothetical protein
VLAYRLSDGERPTLKEEALRGFIIQHLSARYNEFKVVLPLTSLLIQQFKLAVFGFRTQVGTPNFYSVAKK